MTTNATDHGRSVAHQPGRSRVLNTVSGQEAPIAYTLRVAGRLDARWADWFDGFTLADDPDGTTTITGAVTDQAQLHGLLARIRDLGLTLVSLGAGPPSDPLRPATSEKPG